MFTGLIQKVGRVVSAEPTAHGVRFVVDGGGWDHRPNHGDSIAVNGCCLTVAVAPSEGVECGGAGAAGPMMVFDVIGETLARTTLGGLGAGDAVNLEHAARADTLLGGHIVQGHVDAVGLVRAVREDPDDWRVTIGFDGDAADVMDLIAPKGSVTVEGVSLTVAEARADAFVVALIPTTLDKTTLRGLRVGDGCNIETDIIARQVVHYLRRTSRGG